MGGEGGGSGARESDFFYKESKSIFLFGGRAGGMRQLIFFTNNPNLK